MYNTLNELINNTSNYAQEKLYNAINIKITLMSFTPAFPNILNASFVIRSGDSNKEYTINVLNVTDQNEPFACSCPSYNYDLHGTCKHIASLLINELKIYDTNIIESSSVTRDNLSHVWCSLRDYIHTTLDTPISDISFFKGFTLNDDSDCHLVDIWGTNTTTPMTPPRVNRCKECPGAPSRFARPPTEETCVPFNTPFFAPATSPTPPHVSDFNLFPSIQRSHKQFMYNTPNSTNPLIMDFEQVKAYDNAKSLIDRSINLVVSDILSREHNIDQLIAEKMTTVIKNMYSLNM